VFGRLLEAVQTVVLFYESLSPAVEELPGDGVYRERPADALQRDLSLVTDTATSIPHLSSACLG